MVETGERWKRDDLVAEDFPLTIHPSNIDLVIYRGLELEDYLFTYDSQAQRVGGDGPMIFPLKPIKSHRIPKIP